MMRKLFVAATIAGVLCGYVALLYALIYVIVSIDHSHFLRLAM
jgi:hypothetical protein